jgi:cytochrome c biogenesis protein CcmG/thiol:disulfide interchange protein DsbE
MLASTVHKRGFILTLFGLLVAIASPFLLAKEAYLRSWPASRPTPHLQLNDVDGKEWNIADMRGKVVLVNFWATWCEPCVEELPFLNELAKRHAQGKLVILGVNFKEPASRIRQFSAARGLDYPILLDQSGEDFKQWAGTILPTTVLVDRNGKARWRSVGALDPSNESFRQTLERMLKE